jgi:hypothetical protein
MVNQLSVFLENKEGRLGYVLKVLADHNVNLVSVSLADTSDFGLLRMLVDDTDKAAKVLKEAGVLSRKDEIIAISVPNKVGSLEKVFSSITDAGINIEYVYGLSIRSEGASIAVKTSDPEKTVDIIKNMKVKVFSEDEISNI